MADEHVQSRRRGDRGGGRKGEKWEMPFAEVPLGCRFRRNRHADIDERDGELLRTKCERVVSHVFSTGSNGSLNLTWSMERVMRVKRWENQDLEDDF